MGATTAHKAPERMADGMCTRGYAWMTDRCRRRMNGREGYITTEDHPKHEGGQKAHRKERGSWDAREVGSSRPRARHPFSLGCWAVRFCLFFTPKTSSRIIKSQLLDSFSTNSLKWARSENQDPTIGAVCGKVARAIMSAIAC